MNLMTCRLIALAILTLLLSIGAGLAKTISNGFHPAMTGVEHTLDLILLRVRSDPQAFDNLVGGRGQANFHPSIDYRGLLSGALLDDIARTQRETARSNCGDRVDNGDECGLDFVPVTCSQDDPPSRLYRTERETADSARIAYRSATDNHVIGTYTLTSINGRWQLDGIDCGDVTFNWDER